MKATLKRKPSTFVGAGSQKPKKTRPTSKPPSIIDVDTDRDSGIHNNGPGDNGATEPVPEDEQAELGDLESYLDSCENAGSFFWSERLKNDWNAPIYAFFEAVPNVEYHDGRRFHEFLCAAKGCHKKIRRYLDTKDSKSTSNLRKHAKQCWGPEAVDEADRIKDAEAAREAVTKQVSRSGSITHSFERRGKGKATYSHRRHTRTETK